MSYEAFHMKELGFTTRQLHAGYDPSEHYRSKAVPVYQTAVFELGDYDRCVRLFEYAEEGHSYVRFSNPTNEVLEKRISSLEGGTAAVSMASGMAAISNAILNLCEKGDHSSKYAVRWKYNFDFIASSPLRDFRKDRKG